ncbi:unnamed protein product [Discula destructiva]
MSASLLSATHPIPPAQPAQGEDDYADADSLRTTFALAMSAMYSTEVPLYSDLIRIVQTVNRQVLAQQAEAAKSGTTAAAAASSSSHVDSVERLTLERHGAIRLGTPHELHTARRIFALMGMRPVGYYDLAVAGLPMHATCFRPVTAASLEANPFRVFTTLLRPDLLTSASARELALRLLSQRQIFTPALLALLTIAESAEQGGRLTRAQGEAFVTEALRSFGWQPVAAATAAEYAALRAEHAILADIACFRAAHINHLTPRALDIDMAHARMVAEGLRVKASIEGPPRRRCPVLLRQTSFLALEEGIRFPCGGDGDGDGLVAGHHKARFGEIEERGAAVTGKGRKLYDELIAAHKASAAAEEEADKTFAEAFARVFPDSWDELRRQKLIYCEYSCCEGGRAKLAGLDLKGVPASSMLLDELVQRGVLSARPLTYEDFLPFSAAGIFQSNLQQQQQQQQQQQPPQPQPKAPTTTAAAAMAALESGDREGYEKAMECSLLDSDQLYAKAQRRSLERCAAELGLDVDIVADLMI